MTTSEMTNSDLALIVSVGAGVDEFTYQPALSSFEDAGFHAVVEKRDAQVFAALHYLGPTALMLLLLKPYWEKFLGKLGEDNYNSCKAGLSALWAKFVSRNRQVRSTVTGTQGKVSDASLLNEISFLAKTSDDQSFRLLFPRDVSEEDFSRAVVDFYVLLAQHERDPKASPLKKPVEASTPRLGQRIVTLRPNASSLVEIDVVESARSGTLTFVVIGPGA